ncbi:Uncharacterized protein OBRU01_21455 [Operophtera brumata]|uniref:Dynein regulatory complex subunit 7 MORN domain-containing protein n=1 Tax=Operophtera brumata TaxID=104452 RepID=A0A0L7KTG2_OPEBR|nr:Uncharacterized protein OBRU01_22862 [Operophtera brumata]KOB66319.1 Uncharacterized protein OBRU01_21455 [Operophtera brumata]
MSPYTAIIRRSGNPFELAHVVVSWLIGAGYDAYVAVVYVPPPPDQEPRYRLVPLPDLTSKYCQEMERKEAAEKQAAIDKIENKRLKKIALLEQPPDDDINGWRTHAWVLILPGFMDVTEPFFIEPSEGNGYPINAKQYHQIQSIYSNENYYCWEHLLAGEPFFRRQLGGIDYSDKKTAVDTDKHLDVPASWVEKLDISSDEYEQRYPGSHKVIHYKKVLLEKFSHYSERDGIVKRVKVFDDYALTIPIVTYEWYKHRVDLMETLKIDHVKREMTETFGNGRKEHLTSVRTLEFNYYARLDHLTKLVCTPLTFEELESRLITYTEGTKAEPKRAIRDIVETYSRNKGIPAKQDVWRKTFHLQENTIDLQYHYAYNFVTNNTRSYIKPNLAETGGKILFYPDKTSGYIADPCAKLPRALDVYYGLCDNIDLEYQSNKHIRDRETDTNEYLKQRHRELTEPRLYVALFDTAKNEAAKTGWKEQIDPLAPYLARMFGSGHGAGSMPSLKEATLVREQCVNDFKSKQLARQSLVQERFDKEAPRLRGLHSVQAVVRDMH